MPGSDHSGRGVSSEKEERRSVRDDLVLATPTPTGLTVAGYGSPSFYRHGNAGKALASLFIAQGSDASSDKVRQRHKGVQSSLVACFMREYVRF